MGVAVAGLGAAVVVDAAKDREQESREDDSCSRCHQKQQERGQVGVDTVHLCQRGDCCTATQPQEADETLPKSPECIHHLAEPLGKRQRHN